MSKSGSAAVDIKERLISAGIGFRVEDNPENKSWLVFVGQQPANPDNVITLYDFGFKNNEPCMNSNGLEGEVEYKGLQVKVRCSDYETGYLKAEEIRQNLGNTLNFDSFDGIYEYNLLQKTDIIPIGEDDGNNREAFTQNFQATRTKN